jgi:uncharacterized protein (DUF488 family)
VNESAAQQVGAPAVYTIGHSNVSQETFIALLNSHSIEVLVDVRSAPYSKYVPHFNGDALKQAVLRAGIKYLYLGRELGGRPREREYYDSEGHARYDLIAESPQFREGIERLSRGIREHRIALMCNEEDPSECHRRLLVGRVLMKRGVAVLHIRGDGRVQPEAELAEADRKGTPAEVQQEFSFAEREKPEWKSTRSVSQAKPRGPSSGR